MLPSAGQAQCGPARWTVTSHWKGTSRQFQQDLGECLVGLANGNIRGPRSEIAPGYARFHLSTKSSPKELVGTLGSGQDAPTYIEAGPFFGLAPKMDTHFNWQEGRCSTKTWKLSKGCLRTARN